MSLTAVEVIKLAIDAIYDGVKPHAFGTQTEVDQSLMIDRERALMRCDGFDEFGNLLGLIVAYVGNGNLGAWERDACRDFVAELAKSLEASPFFPTSDGVLDDVDERVADRDFFIGAGLASLMIGCSLESLYKQAQRGRITAITVHGLTTSHYKHNDKWLMIPIAYVDRRKEEKKRVNIRKSQKSEHICENCVKMSTVA